MAEIFLMEDSAPLRRILTEVLRSADHNVTAMEDGLGSQDRDFLDRADLLVTDIEMPRIGGIAVIASVRMSHPNLPIIVVSGKAESEIQQSGYDEYLHKPVDPDHFIDVINRHLARAA